MNGASWLGFGIASTVTKTFLHFLPAAAGVGAPYQVDLKVTVGGSSLPRRSLSVDGARLGHPDGFRLEEAVPALSQQVSGLYLLQVDLSPSQQRVDLNSSCILIEMQYQQGAVRYMPRRISPQEVVTPISRANSTQRFGSVMARGIFNPAADLSTGFAIRDPSLFASLVILNSSSLPVTAKIYSSRSDEAVGSVQIGSDAVKEFELTDLGLTRAIKLDSTWGSVEVEAFRVVMELDSSPEDSVESPQITEDKSEKDPTLGAAAAAYVVYRDRNSRRISSIVAL